jgi:predicted Zn-dependent peptidase
MTARVTTLNNGVRVVTDSMPHLQTTSLGVWIAVGSRDEQAPENGLSHMLEHMAFKGTAKRTAQDIAEQIEALGGELNAATGHEATAYYARVLTGDEPAALEILADILLAPLFEASEFARERDVILQEIAATFDTPDDITFDLLHEIAYPDQPLGRPIIGTEERLKAFTTDHLKAFLKKHYVSENMVISAAGGVQHDDLVRHAEALFGGLPRTSREAGAGARYVGGIRTTDRAFEQTHLAIGLPGPAYGADQYFAAQVFAGIFGGGMSSRLFQEVREKRGLCYSIYASIWSLKDTGMTYLHAATAPEAMDELTDVIGQVFGDLRQTAPTDKEIQRAKAQLKVGLVSALESSAARAEQMARHLSGLGKLLSPSYLIERVEAVSASDVLAYANAIGQGQPSVSVVGAGQSAQQYGERAATRLVAG